MADTEQLADRLAADATAPPAPPREDAKAGGSAEAALQAALIAIAEGYHVTAKDDRYILVENPKFEQDNGEDPYLRVDVATLSSPKVVHPLGATGGGSVEQSTEADRAREEGFIVDSHCYPWVAYKGARFNPTEWKYIRTDDECALPPRDAGQATGAEPAVCNCELSGKLEDVAGGRCELCRGAEPDGAALADEIERVSAELEKGLTAENAAGVFRRALAVAKRASTVATLRTSAPPAQPSEAQVEAVALALWQERTNLKEKPSEADGPHLRRSWGFIVDQARKILQAATLAPPRETEPRPVEDRWQPIDTAPKDGGDVLVFVPSDGGEEAYVTISSYEDKPYRRGFRHRNGACRATHWQPLPPAPGEPRPVEQTGSGDAEIERLKDMLDDMRGDRDQWRKMYQNDSYIGGWRERAERAEAEIAHLTEAAAARSDAGLRARPSNVQIARAIQNETHCSNPAGARAADAILTLFDEARAALAASLDAGAGRTRGGTEGA